MPTHVPLVNTSAYMMSY